MLLNSESRRALKYQYDDQNVQKGATTLQERRNILQARLNSWFKIQVAYIPVAQSLRAAQHINYAGTDVESDEDASSPSTDIDAEKAALFLPSQLPPSLWSTGCMVGLHEIERKFWIAQASDTLEQLKEQLCVYSGLVRYKIDQVSGPGQKANTRARNLLVRFREKIARCAERYRVSRAALERLDATGDWREHFRPLLASDVKGPNGQSPDDVVLAMSKRPKQSKGTGKGHRELSWIWRTCRKIPHPNGEELSTAGGIRATSEADLDICMCSA